MFYKLRFNETHLKKKFFFLFDFNSVYGLAIIKVLLDMAIH